MNTEHTVEEIISEDYSDTGENNDNNQDPVIEDEDEIIEGNMKEEIKKQNKYLQYKLPDIDYLDDPIEITTHNDDELREKGKQIDYALNSFGVSGNAKDTCIHYFCHYVQYS